LDEVAINVNSPRFSETLDFTIKLGYGLTINSIPEGIPFWIDDMSLTTPIEIGLLAGSYTIRMPSNIKIDQTIYYFQKWENGSTSSTRVINLQRDTVITASYSPGAETGRIPPNDEWTEPDYTASGDWFSGTGSGVVELDSQTKAVREHAIRHTTKSSDYYGAAVFRLHDGKEVNCDLYSRFVFVMALEESFSGIVTIVLEDAVGNSVGRDEVISVLEWRLLTLLVGSINDALWEHIIGTTFDWTKVKSITWYCHFPNVGTGKFWVDGIYFTYKIEGARALDITVVVKGTDPAVPVEGATVVYGHLVGIDPTTNKETYFWMDGEKKITGADGKAVFSGLEPDWYGLKVSAKDFKEAMVPDLDLRSVDQQIMVELEPTSIWDVLLPILVLGGITFGIVIIVEKL